MQGADRVQDKSSKVDLLSNHRRMQLACRWDIENDITKNVRLASKSGTSFYCALSVVRAFRCIRST